MGNAARPALIELAGVEKSFGHVRALDHLDMIVPCGTLYGLVGRNGAGKSTALHHIAGAMRPDAGRVLIDGQPVYENPAAKQRIASVPSEFFYRSSMRVADLRDLHAHVFPRFRRERFDELEPTFGLDLRRHVRSLSKGQRQQLALWLALSQRPEILVLDEPLDGLDPSARQTTIALIKEENLQQNTTVITSSHNLRELADICTTVGIMDAGRMVFERELGQIGGRFTKVQAAFGDEAATQAAFGDEAATRTFPDARGENATALPGAGEENATLGSIHGESAPLPGVTILHDEVEGALHTIIAAANAEDTCAALERAGATFVNIVPLSLEEVFIYELGGDRHGIL